MSIRVVIEYQAGDPDDPQRVLDMVEAAIATASSDISIRRAEESTEPIIDSQALPINDDDEVDLADDETQMSVKDKLAELPLGPGKQGQQIEPKAQSPRRARSVQAQVQRFTEFTDTMTKGIESKGKLIRAGIKLVASLKGIFGG